MAPLLELLGQAQTTAIVNKTLGTHITPWELRTWPMEFVEAVIVWACPDSFATESD